VESHATKSKFKAGSLTADFYFKCHMLALPCIMSCGQSGKPQWQYAIF